MNKGAILFLIFLLHFSYHSLSEIDPHFTNCQPFNCGDLNITYPFYVDQYQQPYCSAIGDGLKITCKDQKQPIINILGDSYLITNISYTKQILHIINSALLNLTSSSSSSCPLSSIHNLTVTTTTPTIFNSIDMIKKTSEILILQNCRKDIYKRILPPSTSSSSIRELNISSCGRTSKNSSNSVSLAIYKEDLKQGTDFSISKEVCEEVISVRYDSVDSVYNIQDDLRRGFSLKWIADDCTICKESGGRCGYINTTTFKCFCPDRPHSVSCKLTEPSTKSDKRKKLAIIIGSGAVLLLVMMHVIFFWCHRKIKQGMLTKDPRTLDRTATDLETSMHYGVPVFSYDDLKAATNGFDSAKELGEGGFGVVYHGTLKDGREVAVKCLYEKNYKRIEQFINEIQILTSLRHKNLVTLYGCTSRHSRQLVLVYEYVPNKTVADHLHDAKTLTWPIRMKIAIETATALAYLHASDIIHRDVKTNNILLDNDFSVKVADFGLSRLFPTDVTHVSTAPQGTPGYVDPEYYQCYHLTSKSDVYSFGVVLTELLSSLPAVDTERQRHEINLSNYALNRIHCCAFGELVDPNLGFDKDFKIKRMTTLVAELAFQCLQHERELRPTMEEVLETLKRIDSADYSKLEAEEEEIKASGIEKRGVSSGSTKPPLSPGVGSHDDVGILRNAQQVPPRSPDTVMEKWTSRSTTPNTSN